MVGRTVVYQDRATVICGGPIFERENLRENLFKGELKILPSFKGEFEGERENLREN